MTPGTIRKEKLGIIFNKDYLSRILIRQYVIIRESQWSKLYWIVSSKSSVKYRMIGPTQPMYPDWLMDIQSSIAQRIDWMLPDYIPSSPQAIRL